MKNRTVLIILSIALLLFIYIFAVDERLMSTDEKKARSQNVFETLRADLVDKIELETENGKVTLAASETAPGEEEVWRITEPADLRADDTEVQALISAFDFLIYKRIVDAPRSDKRFGFDTPKVKGAVHFRNKKVSFTVGANVPDQDGVYVYVDSQPNHFFVASVDFLESVNKGVNDLRDKHLLQLNAQEISGFVVKTSKGPLRATRDTTNGTWQLEDGDRIIAGAATELAQLVSKTANLEVIKFVDDHPKDVAPYGFDNNAPTISLSTQNGGTETVELGADCGEDAVFARIEGKPAVHCIAESFRSLLERPKERYFEKRLLPILADTLERVVLEKGQDKIELVKADSSWHVSGLTDDETSQTEFSVLFDELSKKSATTILFPPTSTPGDTTDQSDNTQLFPAKNAPPLVKVNAQTGDGKTAALSVFEDPSNTGQLLVQRDGSAGWLLFSKDILPLLEPYPLRFRKKVMTQCSVHDVTAAQIKSNGKTFQQLKKVDGNWRIDSPAAAEADNTKIKKLLSLSCETPVAAYPEASNDPFAADKMLATVTVSYIVHTHDGETQNDTQTGEATIEIGASADSGTRFARIKEKPEIIFSVDNQYTSFLLSPMAARNLLSIESSNIRKVVFKDADTKFVATKSAEQWQSTDCTIDSDAMERIVTDFGAAKAIDTDAFTPRLTPQTARIEFHGDDNTPPATLLFGDTTPQNDGIRATREGLNISFILPARLLRDLKAVCTAK
ncbi:MAG: DUF4340 domain-containing protein [Deltaproteobacteria bacterium]|nr:DUF4340 domain-containing protein [Deltaproteobacteria bacterium]